MPQYVYEQLGDIRYTWLPKSYLCHRIQEIYKRDYKEGLEKAVNTITADNEVELISAILEWFGHKNYERKFKY